MIGMAAAAGIALWKRLPVVTGLILLGVLIELTGLSESNVWFSFAFAVTIGMAIGVINGVLVTSLGIPSFIVTLGLFLTWTGVTLDAVQSQSIGTSNYEPWFSMTHRNMSPTMSWAFLVLLVGIYGAVTVTRQMRRGQAGVSHDTLQLALGRVTVIAVLGGALVWWLNQNRNPNPGPAIEGMPWALSVPITFMVIFTIVLTRTSWGRHLYAIGGNIEAARRTGIPVDRIRITAFVLCSSMAAMGGLFLADYTGGAQPALGQGNTLLYAVAAAVIGGTSLFGGRGKPRDALIGAFVIAMIPNGIQLHGNLPISFVAELTGVVLLIAAAVDATSRRRSRSS
jgi:D-xylose transport system permease protein